MSDLTVIVNLTLAFFLGGIVGWFRELEGKTAGMRTHILVCVGSALFMIVSYKMMIIGSYGDPSRIAAGVVTGIGFLGAGVIIKGEHGTITNLTTAASVWFGCSIGIAIGYGLYFMALIGIIFAAAVPRIPSVSKEHSPFRKNGKGKKSAL